MKLSFSIPAIVCIFSDSPECFNNTYGPNCTYQCQCNFNNTVSCHPVTGNCTCSPGWADPRCDTDIDECSTDTHNCSDPLEVCVNSIGGYDCVCTDGYEKNISNSCQRKTFVHLSFLINYWCINASV